MNIYLFHIIFYPQIPNQHLCLKQVSPPTLQTTYSQITQINENRLILLFWQDFYFCQLWRIISLINIQKNTIINFDYRKQQMETQSALSTFFTSINQNTSTIIRNQPILFQSSCSLDSSSQTNHYLKIIGNTLVLEHTNTLPTYLSLNFDLKFEVLYQTDKNVLTSKLGIRLYDDSNSELKIFFDSNTADQWCRIIGKKINQKGFHEMFKPIKKLGKGNFATVYEAERITDKAKFAVKAFSKQACFSAKNGKESLINQLAILRELNEVPQQNILKLQGVFQSDNSIYVILELLTGKTLFQTIQDRKGCFSQRQIKQLMNGLLKGLRHMHNKRIMHRDLKPDNIMLRGDSLEPVIVDFGLATNCDQPEYLYFRCGTPGYVPPEIVCLQRSEHIEPVCDIFSLGAVFHILTCRKALFAGTKYEEVYENNKQFKIKFQGEHFKGVSPKAKELLKRMLTLEPTKRITAEESLVDSYFFEQASQENDCKISSPVFTDVSVSFKDQKRRRGLLCN